MDRYWFFTWRTYGTWLPGDGGFVGFYHTASGERQIDNRRGEPTTEAMPPLAEYAGRLLAHEPILLTPEAAGVVLIELLRTCRHREWQPDAVAILPNHVHFVFGVPGDPAAEDLLREIKSYTSRALNRAFADIGGWSADRRARSRAKARGKPSSVTPTPKPIHWWCGLGAKRGS